jgi:hypothetical protein
MVFGRHHNEYVHGDRHHALQKGKGGKNGKPTVTPEVHQLNEDMQREVSQPINSDHSNRRRALQKRKGKKSAKSAKGAFIIDALDTYDTYDTYDETDYIADVHADDHALLLLLSVLSSDEWHSCASSRENSSSVCHCGFSKEQMYMCREVERCRKDIAKHGTSYPLYQCFVEARLGADRAFIISPSGASMSIKWI